MNVACVVACADEDAGCLAYAVRDGRRVRWYGVTAPHQDPIELRGVRGYVIVDEELRSEVDGLSSWQP